MEQWQVCRADVQLAPDAWAKQIPCSVQYLRSQALIRRCRLEPSLGTFLFFAPVFRKLHHISDDHHLPFKREKTFNAAVGFDARLRFSSRGSGSAGNLTSDSCFRHLHFETSSTVAIKAGAAWVPTTPANRSCASSRPITSNEAATNQHTPRRHTKPPKTDQAPAHRVCATRSRSLLDDSVDIDVTGTSTSY